MPRQPRNLELLKQVGLRLKLLIDSRDDAVAEVATGIGHVSPSTLYAAMRGESGLDIASITALALLRWPGQRIPNLHWLLTGQGTTWLAATAASDQAGASDRDANLASLMIMLQRELAAGSAPKNRK